MNNSAKFFFIVLDFLSAYRTSFELSEARSAIKLIYKVANHNLMEALKHKPIKKSNLTNIDMKLEPIYVNYIKIDYIPLDKAPKIPPLYNKVGWSIKAPDIFEILRNKPVEVIKKITIISKDQLVNCFKDYHKVTFEYNCVVTFYIGYIEDEFYKISRESILLVDLYD